MINRSASYMVLIFLLFLIVLVFIMYLPRFAEKSEARKFTNLALKNKDYLYCERISSEKYKEECYYALAIETKDKNHCEQSGQYKEKCLSQINPN